MSGNRSGPITASSRGFLPLRARAEVCPELLLPAQKLAALESQNPKAQRYKLDEGESAALSVVRNGLVARGKWDAADEARLHLSLPLWQRGFGQSIAAQVSLPEPLEFLCQADWSVRFNDSVRPLYQALYNAYLFYKEQGNKISCRLVSTDFIEKELIHLYRNPDIAFARDLLLLIEYECGNSYKQELPDSLSKTPDFRTTRPDLFSPGIVCEVSGRTGLARVLERFDGQEVMRLMDYLLWPAGDTLARRIDAAYKEHGVAALLQLASFLGLGRDDLVVKLIDEYLGDGKFDFSMASSVMQTGLEIYCLGNLTDPNVEIALPDFRGLGFDENFIPSRVNGHIINPLAAGLYYFFKQSGREKLAEAIMNVMNRLGARLTGWRHDLGAFSSVTLESFEAEIIGGECAREMKKSQLWYRMIARHTNSGKLEGEISFVRNDEDNSNDLLIRWNGTYWELNAGRKKRPMRLARILEENKIARRSHASRLADVENFAELEELQRESSGLWQFFFSGLFFEMQKSKPQEGAKLTLILGTNCSKEGVIKSEPIGVLGWQDPLKVSVSYSKSTALWMEYRNSRWWIEEISKDRERVAVGVLEAANLAKRTYKKLFEDVRWPQDVENLPEALDHEDGDYFKSLYEELYGASPQVGQVCYVNLGRFHYNQAFLCGAPEFSKELGDSNAYITLVWQGTHWLIDVVPAFQGFYIFEFIEAMENAGLARRNYFGRLRDVSSLEEWRQLLGDSTLWANFLHKLAEENLGKPLQPGDVLEFLNYPVRGNKNRTLSMAITDQRYRDLLQRWKDTSSIRRANLTWTGSIWAAEVSRQDNRAVEMIEVVERSPLQGSHESQKLYLLAFAVICRRRHKAFAKQELVSMLGDCRVGFIMTDEVLLALETDQLSDDELKRLSLVLYYFCVQLEENFWKDEIEKDFLRRFGVTPEVAELVEIARSLPRPPRAPVVQKPRSVAPRAPKLVDPVYALLDKCIRRYRELTQQKSGPMEIVFNQGLGIEKIDLTEAKIIYMRRGHLGDWTLNRIAQALSHFFHDHGESELAAEIDAFMDDFRGSRFDWDKSLHALRRLTLEQFASFNPDLVERMWHQDARGYFVGMLPQTRSGSTSGSFVGPVLLTDEVDEKFRGRAYFVVTLKIGETLDGVYLKVVEKRGQRSAEAAEALAGIKEQKLLLQVGASLSQWHSEARHLFSHFSALRDRIRVTQQKLESGPARILKELRSNLARIAAEPMFQADDPVPSQFDALIKEAHDLVAQEKKRLAALQISRFETPKEMPKGRPNFEMNVVVGDDPNEIVLLDDDIELWRWFSRACGRLHLLGIAPEDLPRVIFDRFQRKYEETDIARLFGGKLAANHVLSAELARVTHLWHPLIVQTVLERNGKRRAHDIIRHIGLDPKLVDQGRFFVYNHLEDQPSRSELLQFRRTIVEILILRLDGAQRNIELERLARAYKLKGEDLLQAVDVLLHYTGGHPLEIASMSTTQALYLASIGDYATVAAYLIRDFLALDESSRRDLGRAQVFYEQVKSRVRDFAEIYFQWRREVYGIVTTSEFSFILELDVAIPGRTFRFNCSSIEIERDMFRYITELSGYRPSAQKNKRKTKGNSQDPDLHRDENEDSDEGRDSE